MSHATFIHFCNGRKKKLKTFLDYPLFVQGLTKGSLKRASPSSKITSTPSKAISSPKSLPENKTIPKNTPVAITPTNKVPTMVYNPQEGKVTRRKSIIRIKKQEVTEKEHVNIYHGDETVVIEKITILWKQYYSEMKSKLGGFSSSIIGNCEPILLEDKKTIHLIFRNETNEMEFNKMSLKILEFLKSNLKNNHLSFTTEVSMEKAKKILYTNRDKFDHFVEQHPKLLEWEQKLGLELK